jgi:outer membrane protein
MTGKRTSAVVIVLLVCVVAYAVYDMVRRPRTGYVLIQEVYNNFNLKKELEKKYETTKKSRDKIVDSLELELKLIMSKLERQDKREQADMEMFESKKQFYLQKKQMFNEDNAQLSAQYDKEILGQLNQYVTDFGKEKGYTYIWGNDGNGSLMYAKDEENLTQEVIKYINNKYAGAK